MTITIDLKPETMAALQADAEVLGRDPTEVAARLLDILYSEEEETLDEETLDAIGRGLADVEAGRTFSLEESRAITDAVLDAFVARSQKARLTPAKQ